MKLKRKGGLTAGIITLSAVALTSVGFAAWVISAGDTATVTGNIDVDTVEDDSHLIREIYEYRNTTLTPIKTGGSSAQSIKFGAPVTNSLSSARWLSNSEDDAYESLTATYYVLVANGQQAELTTDYVKAGFIIEDQDANAAAAPLASNKGYAGAQSLGLVANSHTVEVAVATSEASALTTAVNDTDLTDEATWFKVTVAFNWGSLFSWNTQPEFSTSATYKKGDVVKKTVSETVTYYVCNDNGVTGTWNSEKWEEIYDVNNPFYYYNSMLSNTKITDGEVQIAASAHANKYLTALNKLLTNGTEATSDDVSYTFEFRTYANLAEKTADNTFVSDGSAPILKVVA